MPNTRTFCAERRAGCPAFDADLRRDLLARPGPTPRPAPDRAGDPPPRIASDPHQAEVTEMRNLLFSLGMPMIHLCPDFRLQYFTQTASRAFGVSAADLGNRPAFLSLPGIGAETIDLLSDVFRTGHPATRHAGDPRDAARSWRILPYIDADGSRQGVILFVVPVTLSDTQSAAGVPPMPDPLTPRQRQIMAMVLAGHPSKNIAADLQISRRTVENHRAAIMRRTGATSLPALARIALGAASGGDRQGAATELLPC